MKIIVFNQNNIVDRGSNNQLIYDFPNSVTFKDHYIAVSSISIYYSWFNIAQIYNNNFFTYTWTSGANTQTFTITIPDGLYQIKEVNEFIQFSMIDNGTYWIDSTGQYVYPFNFILNPTRYAVQLNTYLIPDSLPANATVPGNFAGWPTDPQNCVVSTPDNFCNLIGFSNTFVSDDNVNDSYVPPPGSSTISKNGAGTISYLSTTAPNLQPNSNLLFQLSNVNNELAPNSGIIYSLTPNVGVGELISEKPPQFIWNKLIGGTYNQLKLTILGTDFRPITIHDPNMTILLTIADREELQMS